MTEVAALLQAVRFAAHKHQHQRRKDKDASPHIIGLWSGGKSIFSGQPKSSKVVVVPMPTWRIVLMKCCRRDG